MKDDTLEEICPQRGVTRRGFLHGVGVAGAGMVVTNLELPAEAQATPEAPATAAGKMLARGMQPVTLQVNGQAMKMEIEPRTTLLNALRNHAEPPVTGPKLVCDQGACGACTVLIDDKPVYGCMQLAMDCLGKKITTVEGFVKDGKLNPVQQAFVAKDAQMCGFCTPGFVTSITALLEKNPAATLEDVKRACSGNTCRCGSYAHIFEAAMHAAQQMKGA